MVIPADMAWPVAGQPPEPVSPRLTPRQRLVLQTYAETGDRAEGARLLGITLSTYRVHLANAYSTLGVQTAIAAFRVLGWLDVR